MTQLLQPLLVAWALWSAFGLRRWTARLGLYVALALIDLSACLWLFVSLPSPQM